MSLPKELSNIFQNKQKSYKMVLILALLSEMNEAGQRLISFPKMKVRFLAQLRDREKQGLPVDLPPEKMATRWENMTDSQVQQVISTPISVLSSILEYDPNQQTIGFKDQLYQSWGENVLVELQDYAIQELENYFSQFKTTPNFSLKQALSEIMSTYLQAKRETFAGHKLGSLVRQSIPDTLRNVPFMNEELKIQGSVGQGNWATIPWIAIMDRRITETTQQGVYIVYLFSENMESVYLTIMQGVTVPLREKGRSEGYKYLKQKVQEIREQLPLAGMQMDDGIYLTSGGLGQDYQVSTVAYYRYDKDQIPEDEQLYSDLNNMVQNYKQYVENQVNLAVGDSDENGSFRYTIANIYLGQGILKYLKDHYPLRLSVDVLIANQSKVLISGDDVKYPRQRITHIGRALGEFGLIEYEQHHYSLTPFGEEYVKEFNDNIWELTDHQIELLRAQIRNEQTQTPLIKSINQAIHIVKELNTFTLQEFIPRFTQSIHTQESWGEVTQQHKSMFMLNWLETLKFVAKTGSQYRYIDDEEQPLVDTLTVSERLEYVKNYIKHKGFSYPDGLIENFYLSLRSKPFVILAGVSGTGKTKLVKLFAEAMGATSANRQFTLIPVRSDWSDPSDLLGYKDLSGVFRPGALSEVLAQAIQPANRHKIYFICLDEMNLARVEHYFSDVLSVIETQEWQRDRIITAPLIQKESLTTEEDKRVYGNLYIPDNVFLIGTVNMDETTHPFSKKVLDRANTIEFNYIQLDQYPDLTEEQEDQAPTAVASSFLRSDYLQLVDVYQEYKDLIEETTSVLVRVNAILEDIHSHVGFRIRDAVCFYMVYNERFQLLSKEAALDMQLLQKILPRVQGSSSSVKRVLLQLMQIATGRPLPLQNLMEDSSELYQSEDRIRDAKYPKSARKIAFMLRRLEEDGFTSYWLS
ncbi:MrcB family domain-containing protein [Paenibacillus hamazuiensis]|uniref:MrcB family domain-containing protein n=1 Tax=Paenibacillus hamazuiensis TaxID=2936508 RepID=UPI002010B696|nr:DUF3578 domain-containing protein [Paenibacillus hamazuiensis]